MLDYKYILIVLILVSCSLAIAYGKRLDERDDQDYQGKMRVTGFRLRDRLLMQLFHQFWILMRERESE